MLGVSRPSVREALRSLEAERLVTLVPNKGPHIPVITGKQATEIYQVRALLEGEAAALAAGRASASYIRRCARRSQRFARRRGMVMLPGRSSTDGRFLLRASAAVREQHHRGDVERASSTDQFPARQVDVEAGPGRRQLQRDGGDPRRSSKQATARPPVQRPRSMSSRRIHPRTKPTGTSSLKVQQIPSDHRQDGNPCGTRLFAHSSRFTTLERVRSCQGRSVRHDRLGSRRERLRPGGPVVDYNDIAWQERGNQHLLDIGALACRRSIAPSRRRRSRSPATYKICCRKFAKPLARRIIQQAPRMSVMQDLSLVNKQKA